MTTNDWECVIWDTGVGCVASAVFMTISWKLSGCWIRKRDVSPPSRPQARCFLGLSFVAVVMLFVTHGQRAHWATVERRVARLSS